MPRPSKPRTIGVRPEICNFKPRGIPTKKLKSVNIALDEFEAIRLADYEGLSHEDASVLMNISRPTFSRLVEKARINIANFLVEGAELVIEGGNVEFRECGCKNCKEGLPTSRIERRNHECPTTLKEEPV
ncbi:MAG: DNA-binding protein [Denitrovibrio sp.]|nr:MAG: DNA-binding protein [Denitrovibrio sp.]